MGDKIEQSTEVSPLPLEASFVESAPVANNTAAPVADSTAADPVADGGSIGLPEHVDSTALFVAGSLHNSSLEQQTRQDIHTGCHQGALAQDNMASCANICRRHASQGCADYLEDSYCVPNLVLHDTTCLCARICPLF